MSETASYGVRSLKGSEYHGSSPSKMNGQDGGRQSQESIPGRCPRYCPRYWINYRCWPGYSPLASIEGFEASQRAVDKRLLEMISMLHRKRGARDKRLMDGEFSRMVVSNFEIVCQSLVVWLFELTILWLFSFTDPWIIMHTRSWVNSLLFAGAIWLSHTFPLFGARIILKRSQEGSNTFKSLTFNLSYGSHGCHW